MTEIHDLTPPGMIVRKRYLPVLFIVIACAVLCIGVTGTYVGSTLQASKSADDIADLKKQLADQKLEYEQRLGKQSAQYALDVNLFGKAVQSFTDALKKMDAKNDRRAAERERAQTAALLAAQKAAELAQQSARKTDQILIKQDVVQQQVTEAASAAKATEKKIDTAVLPAAATPPQPWIGNRR